MSAPNLHLVPDVLKRLPNWVSWAGGKGNKQPFIVGSNKLASPTDSSTWTDFENAVKHASMNGRSGLGFVIGDKAIEEQIIGFDIDGCRNPTTGEIAEWAEKIVELLDSYTEYTPSGQGLRVWSRGRLALTQHVFKLDPSIGFGEKVQIEIYDRDRYFTVTGDQYWDDDKPIDLDLQDLSKAYELIQEIWKKHSAKPPSANSDPIDSFIPGAQIELFSSLTPTTKYHVLTRGTPVRDKPFVVEDGFGRLTYPSASEADLALCTASAFKHGNDPDQIWNDYVQSSLVRDKWTNREDWFRDNTIAKAIKTVERIKAEINDKPAEKSVPVIEESQSQIVSDDPDVIPPFDPSVVNGIYEDFVDVVTRGTTLPPQFTYAITKAFVGLRMAGRVKLELDVEPRFYTALIGETGSGKGESFRRVRRILFPEGATESYPCFVKCIDSTDSGAGLKDFFFEPPENFPVLCYSDEITTLGNKAAGTRNPAILDAMIELANETRITRSLAKKHGGTKVKRDARLAMVVCGPSGEAYARAFPGRTAQGLWDRFYPEFSEPVDAGDLPPIDAKDAYALLTKFNSLDYSGEMTIAPEAKSMLQAFWIGQSPEIRRKPRWRSNLYLDCFMSAFGRGSKTVETNDVEIGIKIFTRQLVIRRACFTTEIPDKVGFYIGQIKKIMERMQTQLKSGAEQSYVAKSLRDFQNETHAYRNNEIHIFNQAWNSFAGTYLAKIRIKKANGQEYEKFIPAAEE